MTLKEVQGLSVTKVKEQLAAGVAGGMKHRSQSKSVYYDGGINLHVGTLKFGDAPGGFNQNASENAKKLNNLN
jgi:hypothetical protein